MARSKAEIQEIIRHVILTRDDITYTHPIFMQCFLPQRALAAGTTHYQIDHGNASLRIKAGDLIDPSNPRKWEQREIPAGAKARLLVAYINDQAIRSKAPLIDMGNSLREFMARNGIPVCGSNGREIIRQAKNLAAAEMLLGTWGDRGAQQASLRIAKGLSFWIEKDDRQGTLWTPELLLSDDYLHALLQHRVPVDFRALVALQANPRAMDVYCWLSYRMVSVRVPTHIPYEALHPVFGHAIKQLKHFKHEFVTALKLAHKYYPTARVGLEAEKLVLYPSPAAIPSTTDRAAGPRRDRRTKPALQTAHELPPEPPEEAEARREVMSSFLIEEAIRVAAAPHLNSFFRSVIPVLVTHDLKEQTLKVIREARTEARSPAGYLKTYLTRLIDDYRLRRYLPAAAPSKNSA